MPNQVAHRVGSAREPTHDSLKHPGQDWVFHVAGEVTLLPRKGIREATLVEAAATVERDDVVVAERGVLTVAIPVQRNEPFCRSAAARASGLAEKAEYQKHPSHRDEGAQGAKPLLLARICETTLRPSEELDDIVRKRLRRKRNESVVSAAALSVAAGDTGATGEVGRACAPDFTLRRALSVTLISY